MTELQKLMADGWSKADALEAMQIHRESVERETLLDEVKRLESLNNRTPSIFDAGSYLPYLRAYVATLKSLPNEAGIAH